jgi:hypothetical protein
MSFQCAPLTSAAVRDLRRAARTKWAPIWPRRGGNLGSSRSRLFVWERIVEKQNAKQKKVGVETAEKRFKKKHSLLIPGKELGACLDAYFAGLAGFRHGQSMSQASRYSCSPCAEKATHRVATFSRIRQGLKIAESRF